SSARDSGAVTISQAIVITSTAEIAYSHRRQRRRFGFGCCSSSSGGAISSGGGTNGSGSSSIGVPPRLQIPSLSATLIFRGLARLSYQSKSVEPIYPDAC